MVPGIDPKVDIVFKRLFGSEANADLLIDLLNAALGFTGDRLVVAVEILNPFNDKEKLDHMRGILDIKDARRTVALVWHTLDSLTKEWP